MVVLNGLKFGNEHTALVTASPCHCLVLILTEKFIFFATETTNFEVSSCRRGYRFDDFNYCDNTVCVSPNNTRGTGEGRERESFGVLKGAVYRFHRRTKKFSFCTAGSEIKII